VYPRVQLVLASFRIMRRGANLRVTVAQVDN
jgi:hypothetical protein